MLEHEIKARISITKVGDAALACWALLATTYVRSLYPNAWGGYTENPSYYWPLFVVCIVCFPLLLSLQGFYATPLGRTRSQALWRLARACLALFILMVLVQFVFKLEYSRPVLVANCVLTFLLVTLRVSVVRALLRSKGMRDGFARRVLIISNAAELVSLRQQFSHAQHIDVVDCINVDTLTGGAMEQLVSRLHQHSVNSVIISLPLPQLHLAERVVHVCEEEGVETVLKAEFFDQKVSNVEAGQLFGQPVLVFSATTSAVKIYESIAKRCLDLVGGVGLLVLFSPLLVAAAVAVKLTSRGPILFKQKRAGLNGREFTMLKFRTMVVNAESIKEGLLTQNEMSGPVFKIKNDPRVTPIGRLLRKYSIDEMPQLWNVVAGDMSLVGPRPLPLDEVQRFEKRSHRRRMSVKPGLTCIWQIEGRNNITDFEQWMKLDIEYVDTWSIWNDLKILFWTIPAVISGRGAK